VALAVLEAMVAPFVTSGQLRILRHYRPVSASCDGDTVRCVILEQALSGERQSIEASYVLDATELGDVLPLAGVEYISGAESQAETGEMHAPAEARPENVQALTWCFALSHDPERSHIIDPPAQWERWRDYVPTLMPAWPGRLLSWSLPRPDNLQTRPAALFPEEARPGELSLWLYRRIVCRDIYSPGYEPPETTLVNWPQNDYLERNIIDKPANEVAEALDEARQLSLSLLYWLQTEAPRPDGSAGYPGLYLRPDLLGSDDGLALAPYIRESRRIRARFTITENHVGTEARAGLTNGKTAEAFPDSVGVGCYRIDLHPSTGGDNYIDISSLPFQIPLGALVPVRVRNLLPACKNLGTTHITNGCYRLHPVEWNIGEAAGALAVFCIERGCEPAAVHERPALLADFQRVLRAQGFELEWPHVHAV
jgi:hypothetical protein